MYVESKIRRIRPEHIGLPNIIAGKRIIKEFVQYEASPEALANCALDYLLNTDMCLKCKADLLEVRNSLQPPDGGPSTAGERTARMVLKLANLN